jgi:hypothetical protein
MLGRILGHERVEVTGGERKLQNEESVVIKWLCKHQVFDSLKKDGKYIYCHVYPGNATINNGFRIS